MAGARRGGKRATGSAGTRAAAAGKASASATRKASRAGNGKQTGSRSTPGAKATQSAAKSSAAAKSSGAAHASSAAKRKRSPVKPPATRRLALVAPEFVDEFGAAGGVPMAARNPGLDRSTSASGPREISMAEFDRQLQELARRVARGFKPDVVVGLAHGGLFVGEALATALKKPFHAVHLVRRSRDHASHTPAGIADDMPANIKGRRVLVVDDIAASGDSLEFALRLARARGAKALATATLVARPGRYEPDFAVYVSDTFFVFPWDYQTLVDEARFAPRGR